MLRLLLCAAAICSATAFIPHTAALAKRPAVAPAHAVIMAATKAPARKVAKKAVAKMPVTTKGVVKPSKVAAKKPAPKSAKVATASKPTPTKARPAPKPAPKSAPKPVAKKVVSKRQYAKSVKRKVYSFSKLSPALKKAAVINKSKVNAGSVKVNAGRKGSYTVYADPWTRSSYKASKLFGSKTRGPPFDPGVVAAIHLAFAPFMPWTETGPKKFFLS